MSTRFIVWSDHHIHNFAYGSKPVYHEDSNLSVQLGWCNSRLLDSVLCIDQMTDYAVKNGIKTFVFTGDLFHKRTVLDVQTYQAAYAYLDLLSRRVAGSTVYLMPGNHDYADRHGMVHSLGALAAKYDNGSSRVVVSEASKLWLSPTVAGYFVPYSDDKAVLQDAFKRHAFEAQDTESLSKHSVLFFHAGIRGGKVGSDYVMDHASDCTLGDLHTENYTLCIGGHYHEHQFLNANTCYVGAMLQHNWGDVGSKRGFLDVEVKESGEWTISQVETSFKRFVELGISDYRALEDKPSVDDTFLRVTLEDGDDKDDVAKELQEVYDFVEVVSRPAPATEQAELSVEAARFDPASVLKEWVDVQPYEGDKAALLAFGKQLLEKAMGQ